jgi:hypothetical protein
MKGEGCKRGLNIYTGPDWCAAVDTGATLL